MEVRVGIEPTNKGFADKAKSERKATQLTKQAAASESDGTFHPGILEAGMALAISTGRRW
jgi:hypothetical protein